MNIPFIAGVVGLGAMCAGFFLMAFSAATSRGRLFYALNVLGSALLTWYSYDIRSIPFMVLEGIWFAIAAMKLAKT